VIFHFSTLLAALAEMEEATACEYQKWFGTCTYYTSLYCLGCRGGGGGVGMRWGKHIRHFTLLPLTFLQIQDKKSIINGMYVV